MESIGYYNKIYTLNAQYFGIPQNRARVYMLSVYVGTNCTIKNALDLYFENNDLSSIEYAKSLKWLNRLRVEDILRNNYEITKYQKEARESQMHDTPSRVRIVDENDKIVDADGKCIKLLKTITTKQDRNPNSGVIPYNYPMEGKLNYRYLTPRECFIAMGFEEKDYDALIDNNVVVGKNKVMFSNAKLIKMAGNSIVVNVLEAIFSQVCSIKDHIL